MLVFVRKFRAEVCIHASVTSWWDVDVKEKNIGGRMWAGEFDGRVNAVEIIDENCRFSGLWVQGPVVQQPINANPRLTIKEFISLLPHAVQRWFLAKLYIRRSQSWKPKISKRKFHQKVENVKQKFTLILD